MELSLNGDIAKLPGKDNVDIQKTTIKYNPTYSFCGSL